MKKIKGENNLGRSSVSAFRYENHLGVIRKKLRSMYKPVQQLANRDKERWWRRINPKGHLGEGEI